MLTDLHLNNFTVFPEANLTFAQGLNIIVGENGTGKSHLLKLAYAGISVCAEQGRKPNAGVPTKAVLQIKGAEKLVNVFRPEALGRLARRRQGHARCEVELKFIESAYDFKYSFATNSKSEISVEKLPTQWIETAPAYLPTRELMSIYPNFVSVYEGHYLEFEETWRDTCVLLGALAQKGAREKRIRSLLQPLEQAMGGSIELDNNGRFYLKTSTGRMEMPLVAEGLRKLGMLSRLIATGALLDKGCLFWDEPEANLNPRLIREVAKSIVELAAAGIQIFIATHSLFLLRELDMLLDQKQAPESRFFGLQMTEQGVEVTQGSSIDDIGDITVLNEELLQTDRFLQGES